MTERERLQNFAGNGDKAKGTFSAGEMRRRLDAIRRHMVDNDVDAALFTSYHNINYYADFMYCQFGRRYGFFVDQDNATSISAGIDGGQPWRRTHGSNLTYTDWQEGQLLPRHSPDHRWRAAHRDRIRPRQYRPAGAAEGRVSGCRLRRYRRPGHAVADDQVGRGDRPYHQDDPDR